MGKERYRRGAHTVTDFKYHFVWKTKYSYAVLRGDTALRMRDIIREICASNQMEVIKGNIRPNHIHILVSAPAYLSPAKIMQHLKGKSSYRLQREFPHLRKKYWGTASMVSRVFWGSRWGCQRDPDKTIHRRPIR